MKLTISIKRLGAPKVYPERSFGHYWTKVLCNKDIEGSTYRGNIVVKGANLTSLEGAPKVVKGDFDCSFNNLVSLKHSPKVVEGDFDCIANALTSLKEGPEVVKGDFDCSINHGIYDLQGSPRDVGKGFYFINCGALLIGRPVSVGGVFRGNTPYRDIKEVCYGYVKNYGCCGLYESENAR